MKTDKILIAVFIISLMMTFSLQAQIQVIPAPAEISLSDGFFKVDSTRLFSDKHIRKVHIKKDKKMRKANPEGYSLIVDKKGIQLKAGSEAGLFYGRQTLRQLYTQQGIPFVAVNDSPRFSYRGLMIDVSRHFFPKEEIMKIMDAMAYYKLNRLHLHLTDAGGWRIQIDHYPMLTEQSAYRTESDWRKWWAGRDRTYLCEGDSGAYGGYYTKADIKEMVAYGESRQITIVPEVEFPGHSEEVFAAYPELCCAGEAHTSGEFCIGNPASMKFMEDVLGEIVKLFPSKYIHVGGDEAGRSAWKKCPKCQAFMKEHGMTNEDELQSYMIRRAEDFLLTKGRKLIGWDEILQGGLAPEATVMSWRGESGGIKAARMGHDVIMTPGGYLYLDAYQADPRFQPYAIGGYTTVKKVYSYDPIPYDSLTTDESHHILGMQGNVWTEYIPTSDHLEYMIFPRALALAEAAWSPQAVRNWTDFKPRMNAHLKQLQTKGYHPFPLSDELDVSMRVDTLNKQIVVKMDAEKSPAEIRYTTDGTTPISSSLLYMDSVIVKDSADIRAAIFKNNELQGEPTVYKADYHRAVGKPIRFLSRFYRGYMAGGRGALVDGFRGGLTYLDGHWQGYLDSLDCVVDMLDPCDIHSVSIRFMQLTGPGVYQPESVELMTSSDGENFTSAGIIPTTVPVDNSSLAFQTYAFSGPWHARYLRIRAPEVHRGFIFADEIVVW